MEDKVYTVGSVDQEWGGDDSQTITFIVTGDCNLRCKYCYITHKSKGKVLSLETAQKFIDYILSERKFHRRSAMVLDFIGGEPLLEAKLIEDICDYFKIRTYEEKSSWYWNYRINISTNGVNYNSPEVQHLIKKNKGKISIGITIDGTKEKHDLQRVFPDGSGSYDIIHNNLKLWLSQFAGNTKVTFASDDLVYLKDSIIHLWKEGISGIGANVVYEDVWKSDDDRVFEEQLKELADYVIENNLYNKFECTLFADYIGSPYERENLQQTSCGAGKMLAISPDGNIYPCMRYYDYSLNHQEGYIIGNVDEGVDFEKLRVFVLAMYKYQCDDECLSCTIARGCEFCQGFSYDESATGTNFYKTKYICKMHKARVRANNYYFAKLFHKTGIRRENFSWGQELLFILANDYMSICSYQNNSQREQCMSQDIIMQGLKFAEQNFMRPVFLHSKKILEEYWNDYENIDVLHYVPIEAYEDKLPFYDYRLVVEYSSINLIENVPKQDIIVFNIETKDIEKLGEALKKLLEKCERVNVNIQNLNAQFDLNIYQRQLDRCADYIIQVYNMTGELKEINILTDILYVDEHEGCLAGDKSYALSPDGKLYACPAFYTNRYDVIGNIWEGLNKKGKHLYTKEYMPLCKNCEAYQCENCKYINKKYTHEVNVSPSFQCKKAHIEKKISVKIQKTLQGEFEFVKMLKEEDYMDPIVCFKDSYK